MNRSDGACSSKASTRERGSDLASIESKALASLLKAERPTGPQVIQGEILVWRRIALRASSLVPGPGRVAFLESCGFPRHLIPTEPGKANPRVSDSSKVRSGADPHTTTAQAPGIASLIVVELRNVYGMTDSLFRQLHHRKNLRASEGIDAHLRYLKSVKFRLRPAQAQLALRLLACLEARREGRPWEAAVFFGSEALPSPDRLGSPDTQWTARSARPCAGIN